MHRTAEIQIAVIGGGVVGCAIAWELSRRYEGIFLFEKNPGITRGENQSSRNSGVIHSGIYYDQETRPLKADLCVQGNRILYDFCLRHEVPALQTGKLMVATSEGEEEVLNLYLLRAADNGVPGVERISGKAAQDLEPNVRARSALWIPSAGIIDPISLVYRLHSLALEWGVKFMLETEVTGLHPQGDALELAFRYRDGARDGVRAGIVINAAGVDADLVSGFLSPDSPYTLDPVMGESYKFYGHKRPNLGVAGKNIYPTPETVMTPHGSHFTVGIHLTPTFEHLSSPPRPGSTITAGPKLVAVRDRHARPEEWTHPRYFAEKIRPFFPGIREEDLIWHQAGLQARLKEQPDFVIASDPEYPRCINLVGIDSPGLTASLAIARRVGEMVAALG